MARSELSATTRAARVDLDLGAAIRAVYFELRGRGFRGGRAMHARLAPQRLVR